MAASLSVAPNRSASWQEFKISDFRFKIGVPDGAASQPFTNLKSEL
jgi:hypothetical protein